MTKLRYDEKLLAELAVRHDPDLLSLGDKIAINLAWRKKARVPILAKLYSVSKNTIYYTCLTGGSAGYPHGATNTAAEVNRLIDEIGVEAAFETYLTDEHVRRTNLALKKTLEAKEAWARLKGPKSPGKTRRPGQKG
jgi:hypothetical protein